MKLLVQMLLYGNAYSAVSASDHGSSFNGLEKHWRVKPLSSGLPKPKSVPVRKSCARSHGNLVSAQADACQSQLSIFPENHWTLKTDFPIWQRRENILAGQSCSQSPLQSTAGVLLITIAHPDFHSLFQFPLSFFARRRLNTEQGCSLNQKTE